MAKGVCAKCVLKDMPHVPSYAAVVLMGHDRVTEGQAELFAWARQNFVASLTQYCPTCREITVLLQSEYATDPAQQLVVASVLRTFYAQTNPRGQA